MRRSELLWFVLNELDSEVLSGVWKDMPYDELPEHVRRSLFQVAERYEELINASK